MCRYIAIASLLLAIMWCYNSITIISYNVVLYIASLLLAIMWYIYSITIINYNVSLYIALLFVVQKWSHRKQAGYDIRGSQWYEWDINTRYRNVT